MQKVFNIIDQSGWTGIIIYCLTLLTVLLLIELHDQKQNKIYVNGRWVENDYDPIGFRVLFAWVIFISSIGIFFTIKYFIK